MSLKENLFKSNILQEKYLKAEFMGNNFKDKDKRLIQSVNINVEEIIKRTKEMDIFRSNIQMVTGILEIYVRINLKVREPIFMLRQV